MLLGYRMKKRSMPAYDKVIVPELRGFPSIPEKQPQPSSPVKRHIRNVLRAAACIVLAFTLISVIVSNNTTGSENSFTLVAYAASATGNSSVENGYSLNIGSIDQLTGVSLKKNTVVSFPVRKNYKVNPGSEEGKFVIDYTSFSYLSGFQFSGDNIESVTMTTQNSNFVAYDYSKVIPLIQKSAKIYPQSDNFSVFVFSDDQLTDSERETMQTYTKSGKSVTFPPAGFTSYWGYTPVENEKTSDTINIIIKFSDSTTQESIVSISEDDHGNIIAVMN